MKKLLIMLTIALLPLLSNAQAHLGATESEIKSYHPDKTFITDYTQNGTKFIRAYMVYGTFYYSFDKESKTCTYCMQVIDYIPYLNGQVEKYNNTYVIISDTAWKGYLSNGGILYITLFYDKENDVYVFEYE